MVVLQAISTSDRVQAIYHNVMSVGTELASKELLSKACGGLSRVLRMDASNLRVREADLKEASKQVVKKIIPTYRLVFAFLLNSHQEERLHFC
jgi:hypothetical protein